MTWEIVTGLIVIVGALVSLGTVLAKLIKTLTTLDVTLKNLQENINKDSESNSKTHDRIFDKLDDHEGRISYLEHEDRGNSIERY